MVVVKAGRAHTSLCSLTMCRIYGVVDKLGLWVNWVLSWMDM
jgi:hypothetical protein